jgi:DNA-binding response OmpR family regulator
MKILIIEDTKKLAKYISETLTEESYVVDQAHDGASGERMAASGSYDLVILDIMLPEKDGISVCRSLREEGMTVPILMLTAKGEVDERIEGLDSGADDYLIKPFDMDELLARVRALLRRPASSLVQELFVQDIVLDPASRTVTKSDRPLNLTLKEYVILEYLMSNAGTVVTREQLIDHCWDFAYSSFSNITDVYIKQLRKKLHDTDEKYIKTVRGVGYLFKTE